jgi:hypothetical protein
LDFDEEFLLPRGVKTIGRRLGSGEERKERMKTQGSGFLGVLTGTPKEKLFIALVASIEPWCGV